MSALVLWKPVEKAISVLAKKPTYQTFLNKFSNAIGKPVTATTIGPYVKAEVAAGGARAVAVKSTLLGAALGVTGDATYEAFKEHIFGSAVDERERQVLESVAGGSDDESIANAIAETLDDTPGMVRGIENALITEAVKTVEESMQLASILVNFAGSVPAAKALLSAIRSADVTDFDVYERLRGY